MPRHPKLTEEEQDRSVAAYEAGQTLQAIADEMGVSEDCIRNTLIRRGIPRRKFNYWLADETRRLAAGKKRGETTRGVSRPARRHLALDEYFFEHIDSEEKAYVLGFLLADGHISYDNHQIAWRLSVADEDILLQIRSAMRSSAELRYYRNGMYPSVELGVSSVLLCEQLLRLGVDGYKIRMSSVPAVSPELERHFLRGLIDGDGTVCITGTRQPALGFVSASKALATYVHERLSTEGGSATRLLTQQTSNASYYRFVIKSRPAARAVRWLYEDATIASNRKLSLARVIIESFSP